MEPVANRRSIRLDGYDYASADSYFITICTQHKEHRFGHIADDKMVLNEAGIMIAERIQAIAGKFPGTLVDSYIVMPNHIHFILILLGYQPVVKSLQNGELVLDDKSVSNGESVPNDGLVRDGGPVGAARRGRPLSDRQVRPGTLPLEIVSPDSGKMPDDSDWLAISGPIGPKAGGHDGPPLQIHHPAPIHHPVTIHRSEQAHHPDNTDKLSNVPSVSEVVGWFKASATNYYINGVKAGTYPAFDRRLWQRNYYEHIIRTEEAYQLIDEYIQTNPQRWFEDRLR